MKRILIVSRSVTPPAPPYAVLLHGSSRRDKLWSEAAWTELGRALGARGLACVLPWGSLTHLAAALGRPVAAIYCGTDANLTRVFGAPRAKNLEEPGDNPSPKEALQALESVGAF